MPGKELSENNSTHPIVRRYLDRFPVLSLGVGMVPEAPTIYHRVMRLAQGLSTEAEGREVGDKGRNS